MLTGSKIQDNGPTTLSTLFLDQAFKVSGWLRGFELLTARSCSELSLGVWQRLQDPNQYRLVFKYKLTIKHKTLNRGHYHFNPHWVQRGHVIGLHFNVSRSASKYCIVGLQEGGSLAGSGLEDADLSRTLVHPRLAEPMLSVGTIYNFSTSGIRMNLAVRPLLMEGNNIGNCYRRGSVRATLLT